MSCGGNGYDSALISSKDIHAIRYSNGVSALWIISTIRLTILIAVLRTGEGRNDGMSIMRGLMVAVFM